MRTKVTHLSYFFRQKEMDHDIIEKWYIEKLHELGSGLNNDFYSMALNRMVYVHSEIIAALDDQPERRQINYVSNVNALYSARYGYSSNINVLKINYHCVTNVITRRGQPTMILRRHVSVVLTGTLWQI